MVIMQRRQLFALGIIIVGLLLLICFVLRISHLPIRGLPVQWLKIPIPLTI